MKKSIKSIKILLIAIVLLLSSGCVKMNATVEIKKDKSLNFNMVYAVKEELLKDRELVSSEDKKQMEKNGYTVKDYKKDGMSGVEISFHYANIDKVSSTEDTKFELNSITDGEKNTKMFKVEKGFFKNVYTLTSEFNSDLDGIGDTDTDYRYGDDEDSDDYLYDEYDNDEDDYDYDYDDDYGDEDYDYDYDDDDSNIDSSFDGLDDASLSALYSSMDLKFEVKLPYKAISSNATTKNDGDKDLVWDLTKMNDSTSITVKFPVYNLTNIILTCVLGIGVIALVVFMILKGGKKKAVTSPIKNDVVISKEEIKDEVKDEVD